MPNPLPSLINSRKTLRVGLGIATVLTTLYFTLPTLTTPEAKMYAVLGAIASIAALFGIDINAIKAEDVATKSAPASQVNVGSDVHNPPPPPSPDDPKGDRVPRRPGPIGPDQSTWVASETTSSSPTGRAVVTVTHPYPPSLMVEGDKPMGA